MRKRPLNPKQGPDGKSTDPLFYYRKKFDAEFPTSAHVVDALVQIGSSEKGERRCKKDCPDREWIRIDDRTIQCSKCKEKVYLTSGTFFQNIRLVTEWLFAVWLFEHRVEANPNRFSKVTGVTYSTSWTIFRKISMIITELISDTGEGDEVRSAGWLDVMTRRSRETQARQSPDSEELESTWRNLVLDDAELSMDVPPSESETVPGEVTASALVQSESEPPLSDVESSILKRLQGEPVFIDVLHEQTGLGIGELSSALVLLQMNGLVQRLPGDRYARIVQNEPAALPPLSSIAPGSSVAPVHPAPQRPVRERSASDISLKVKGSREFIWTLFHGVSRKYLQHYVCVFSFLADAVRWPRGALLEACIGADAISKADIRNYVSPPLITVL